MAAMPRRTTRELLWLGLCLVFAATLSVVLGQDTFWDTKNYHIYNAWAFLQERYTRDITAAGMQSFFNPLPDLPYLLLAQGPLHEWPRVLAAIQGLWFGLLIYLVFRIAARFAELQNRRFGAADLCAVVIGVTGTMAVSQVGSTTNEIQLAVLLLLGFYLLMPLLAPDGTTHPTRRALLAGLCCGFAAGLKPTAVVYPPAMALSLLLALGIQRRAAWHAVTIYTAGVVVAFLLGYGAWGWHLYQTTGNPIFPLFNQLFHSPLTVAVGGTDGQFRPRNILQWLFYPFFWMHKQHGVVTEAGFADPRYALAMLSMLAVAALHLIRRPASTRSSDPALRMLMTFVGVGYVLWMVLFSILRYAVPLEALTGLLMLGAVHGWRPQWWQPQAKQATGVLALLAVLILVTSTYPNWGRGTYARHVFEADIDNVEPHSLVILAGSPDAYLAPMFPQVDGLEFVGLSWFTRTSQGFGIWNATQQRLTEHNGSVYIVRRDDPSNADDLALVQELLPQYHMSDCRPIHSNMEVNRHGRDNSAGLSLCRLLKN